MECEDAAQSPEAFSAALSVDAETSLGTSTTAESKTRVSRIATEEHSEMNEPQHRRIVRLDLTPEEAKELVEELWRLSEDERLSQTLCDVYNRLSRAKAGSG